jgi:hypothetical protein
MRLLPLAALMAAATLSVASPASACATANTGARCIAVPARPAEIVEVASRSSASVASPALEIGAVLPRGEYSIILNAEYYGLPPVRDGWVYMRVGGDAYRVDWRSHQVLERVTERTAANF